MPPETMPQKTHGPAHEPPSSRTPQRPDLKLVPSDQKKRTPVSDTQALELVRNLTDVAQIFLGEVATITRGLASATRDDAAVTHDLQAFFTDGAQEAAALRTVMDAVARIRMRAIGESTHPRAL